MEFLKNYWPFGALTIWLLYKWWRSKKIAKLLPELRKRGAICIDVRSAQEFASGNAPGTVNIPLQEINNRLSEFPKTSPIVLGCASGTRSGMAKLILTKNGYQEIYNIGSWTKFFT